MKKLFTVFLSIVFILLSCVSCKTNDNPFDTSTDFAGDGTTIKDPPPATETVEISEHIPTMYHVKPVNDELPFISGYDENNYYWIWYLGDLENVPLQSNGDFGAGASVVYNGAIDFTYEFSYSQSTVESVEKAISNASSKTTEWTTSNEFSVKNSSEFELNIFKQKIKDTLEVGYARTWGESISNTETISESLINTASKTKTATTTVSAHFDKNCNVGHYRWCLIGDVEVYACIVYNYKDQEVIFCDNIEKVVGTPGYGFEYSQNGKFELDRYDILSFDCPSIETLLGKYKPTKSIDIYRAFIDPPPQEELVVFNKTFRYNNAYKIAGSGRSWSEEISLSKAISELKGEGYQSIHINVSYQLMENDDCYQTVEIYSSTHTYYNETFSHGGFKGYTQAWLFGIPTNNHADKSWKDYSKKITEAIDQFDETPIYLRFRAQNAIYRDFSIKNITVTVTASKSPIAN